MRNSALILLAAFSIGSGSAAAADMIVDDPEAIAEELGDLLFVVGNLARHLKVDPEAALRAANVKFERRFRFIEQALREAGRAMENCALEELDALWGEAKKLEKQQARDC